jgi:hypothetical protein
MATSGEVTEARCTPGPRNGQLMQGAVLSSQIFGLIKTKTRASGKLTMMELTECGTKK